MKKSKGRRGFVVKPSKSSNIMSRGQVDLIDMQVKCSHLNPIPHEGGPNQPTHKEFLNRFLMVHDDVPKHLDFS